MVTALVFHQTGIFEERGLGAAIAAGVFVPFAISSAGASLVAGVAVDRVGPRPMFVLAMVLLLAGLAASRTIDSALTAMLYATALGTGSGVQRIVQSVIWAHYYGRRGLGRVQGSAMAIMIMMSAIGPLPLAALEGTTGSYDLGIALMVALPLLSIVGVTVARVSAPTDSEEQAVAANRRATD